MDYIDILAEINYLSYIGAFIKWILLFLVLSVIVLISSSRLGLFKRQKKISRVLVKLYYIVIPIYFIIFAIKFAPVRNSHTQINKVIEDNKVAVTDFAFDFLNSAISDSVLQGELSVQQTVANYLNKTVYSDSTDNQSKKGYGRKFLYKFKKKIEFSYLSKVLESRVVKEATSLVGINKKTGKAIYKTSFHDLFEHGELVEILTMVIDSFFYKVYKSMIIMFLIGLIFPTIEILLSRHYKY